MIKVIGIDSPDFQQGTVEEVIQYFKGKDCIQLDTETTGFCPHKSDIMCLQLGDSTNQWVIHPSKVIEFKFLLESMLILGHNLKFDLKFLYKYGIYPTRVYDTFLAECVLYCGLIMHRKGLADVAKNRLGVDLPRHVSREEARP